MSNTRLLRCIVIFSCALMSYFVHAKGPAPRKNIRVNMLDKKFKISGVSTVGELQLRIQQESGVEPLKQGSVMFGNRRLSPTDALSDVGVKNGAQLEIVSNKNDRNSKSINSNDNSQAWNRLVKYAVSCFNQTRRLGKTRWKNDVPQSLMDLLVMAQKVIRSSVFEEYIADPKELYQHIERMRQVAFATNLAPQVPTSMQEALKDPIAWRELLLKSIEDIKNLDLEGPQGEQILQDLRELEKSGKLPPMFYEAMTNFDDDDDKES